MQLGVAIAGPVAFLPMASAASFSQPRSESAHGAQMMIGASLLFGPHIWHWSLTMLLAARRASA
jgi:hypothetical protein